MTAYETHANLQVAAPIAAFVNDVLDSENITADNFWHGVSDIFRDLTPRNQELLAERERLQGELDAYHRAKPGQPEPKEYRALLERIGYLVAQPGDFTIASEKIDDEIAHLAGPQLVVPLLNARFAVNAANARWGSLYDALYGTDAIAEGGDLARGNAYNPERGAAVISYGRRILDLVAPLAQGSHTDAAAYRVDGGRLIVVLESGDTPLADPVTFAGFTGDPAQPLSVLLRHHGLHIELEIDKQGTVGSTDSAGINDILLESATTTIMDLEDSVTAVDSDDKALGYRNWHDLMRGTLSEVVTKGGKSFTRVLNDDRVYTAPDGTALTLSGRALLLIRNVGHLMTTDAVLDSASNPVPEGILDAIMTTLGALVDLRGKNKGYNSRSGSLYIVKPKMHGPDEVAFTVELFGRVEQLLGLPQNTLKVGIMDEERRTTVNLRACIAASASRVFFINTGFLDRTGDEIHTSLQAGPMVPKARMKTEPFILAYEDANVDAGLHAGFAGRAQVGKGMWAMPDLMNDMLAQKIAHVKSGASTAWVPSPTAATLHALHYHQVDVHQVQAEVAKRPIRGIDDVLIPPLLDGELDPSEISTELDNNVQSILGYVVRWVDQGIGCSKVPDIHSVALMEDRATLRISSQLLANWLRHGLIDVNAIDDSLQRLASVVDEQNATDLTYELLIGPTGPGIAFEAARRLILEGATQPSGYTEPILHEMRVRKKHITLAPSSHPRELINPG